MDSCDDVQFSDPPRDAISQSSRKTVLHFSDGVLEIDNDDDDDGCDGGSKLEELQTNKHETYVDPATMSWAPWMWYYTVFAGSKALQVCDYMGEALATFFGITTPKYQYEITEYNRIKREEEEGKVDLEGNNWAGNNVLPAASSESENRIGEEFQLTSLSVSETEKKC